MTTDDWTWLPFDLVRVQELLDHALVSEQHRPTPDQMLENRYRLSGAPKPPAGELPPLEDIALEAVPAGLHLHVERGLYMVSNGLSEGGPDALFAPGCNPGLDRDWQATVARAAGVEQQVLWLPADAVAEVLQECGDTVWLGLRRDEERFGVEEYGLAPESGEGSA